ncbi:hypothetical protein U1Q18_018559 [Sarracenia purpurea var. burkii]
MISFIALMQLSHLKPLKAYCCSVQALLPLLAAGFVKPAGLVTVDYIVGLVVVAIKPALVVGFCCCSVQALLPLLAVGFVKVRIVPRHWVFVLIAQACIGVLHWALLKPAGLVAVDYNVGLGVLVVKLALVASY